MDQTFCPSTEWCMGLGKSLDRNLICHDHELTAKISRRFNDAFIGVQSMNVLSLLIVDSVCGKAIDT